MFCLILSGKKPQFSEGLGQNVTGSSEFYIPGVLFPLNNMGAVDKVSGNMIIGIKVLEGKMKGGIG